MQGKDQRVLLHKLLDGKFAPEVANLGKEAHMWNFIDTERVK